MRSSGDVLFPSLCREGWGGSSLFLVICIFRIEVRPAIHPSVALSEGTDVADLSEPRAEAVEGCTSEQGTAGCRHPVGEVEVGLVAVYAVASLSKEPGAGETLLSGVVDGLATNIVARCHSSTCTSQVSFATSSAAR